MVSNISWMKREREGETDDILPNIICAKTKCLCECECRERERECLREREREGERESVCVREREREGETDDILPNIICAMTKNE